MNGLNFDPEKATWASLANYFLTGIERERPASIEYFDAQHNFGFYQDVATATWQPCVMYLNGEYWGFCMMMERYASEYFPTKIKLSAKGAEGYSFVEWKNQNGEQIGTDAVSHIELNEISGVTAVFSSTQ